jgi:hypothetical protein
MKVERKHSRTLPKGSRPGTEYSEPQLGSNPNVNIIDSNNTNLNSSVKKTDDALPENKVGLYHIDRTLWCTSYIIDQLKQHLANVRYTLTNDKLVNVEGRKYYDQARRMQNIGAFRPTPSFIIHISDLTPKLIKEISQLDNESRGFVLCQAVGRIFEDINSELYHNSISKVLRVRFEE